MSFNDIMSFTMILVYLFEHYMRLVNDFVT